MPTTVELIQKEAAALKKAKETYRQRVNKLEQTEYKRILKFLKQANFFEVNFTDSELQTGFEKMVQTKLVSGQPNRTMAHATDDASSTH